MGNGIRVLIVLAVGFLALALGVQEPSNLIASANKSITPMEKADHFLVEFRGSVKKLTAAVESLNGSVERAHPQIGVAKVSGLTGKKAWRLARSKNILRVTRDLEVQWVSPMSEAIELSEIPASAETHNDPSDAFYFDAYQWNMTQVMAPDAWGVEQGDPNVRVAILDTGISPTHMDLAGRYDLAFSTSFVASELFVDDLHFHGTFVSGVISTNNLGVAGIAPHVTLIGVKVLDQSGSGSFADIIAGIIYATDQADADIINMSLAAYFPKNLFGAGPLNAALAKAVNYAGSRGVLVVCSAGNDGADLDHDGNYVHIPSQSGDAFSVNATAPYGQQNFDGLAFYSNYGVSGVDVAAPGGNYPFFVLEDLVIGPFAPSLVGGATNVYVLSSGTSFSAPLAAGIAALIDSRYGGDFNGGQLRARMEQSSDDLGKPGVDPVYSHGRVNAYKAVTQ